MERHLADAKKTIQSDQYREESYKKESNEELNRLRKQVALLSSRSEEYESQNQMLLSERDRIALQLDQHQTRLAEAESSCKLLTTEVEIKTKQEHDLQEKALSLEETVANLQNEISKTNENTEKEVRAYQHNLERQTSTLSVDKQNLITAVSTLQAENEALGKQCTILEEALEKVYLLLITRYYSNNLPLR